MQDQLLPLQLGDDNGGIILDVCDGGVGVQAVAGIPAGDQTQMQFSLPDVPTLIRGHAEVRWAEPSGRLGLRFIDFSDDSIEPMRTWLGNVLRPQEPGGATPEQTRDASAGNVTAQQTASASAAQQGEVISAGQPPPATNTTPSAAKSRLLSRRDALLDVELDKMVRYLMFVTSAEGVAIALYNEGSMVCRASVGSAPAKGSVVPQDSGLTGLCLRTRQVVRSADTYSDVRADRETCRQMKLRSIIVAPILSDGKVLGLLAVFSSRSYAFKLHDSLALTRMAESVAARVRLH